MGWLISPVGSWFLGALLLAAPHPGTSWYKHSASPRYHTVGRASGLLIGVRRSPYLWRRDAKLDNWPVIPQGAEDARGLLHTPWSGEVAELQLSPDPGEKRLIQKLIQQNRQRTIEEERSLNEVEGILQDEKNMEQGSWLYNDLGVERSLEDQSRVTRYQGEEERSLGENMLVTMEPGVGKRSPEETWVTKQPSDVVRSLEDGLRNMRNQERHVRSSLESGQERIPSGEDILSMFLHLQEENRSHPQQWRTAKPFYSQSKTSEWISCENFRLISYKVLCRARLQFLSHSQPRPRLDSEDPAADL
ncbi:neuropeptide W [Rhinoderma darwinii]|uniref:neuropeptide W n=1 Tax=Rhinoderma darwinii TaxID=43563 RepID=UPI003F6719A4